MINPKRALIILAFPLTLGASPPLWKKVSPKIFEGETLKLELRYLKTKAALMTIRTMPPQVIEGRKAHRIRWEIKPKSFYRFFYRSEYTLETFLDKETFLPLKSFYQKKTGDETIEKTLLFQHKSTQVHVLSQRKKKGKILKESRKARPTPSHFQDALSTLYFIRSLPLIPGENYHFPLVGKKGTWIIKARVIQGEKLKIGKKKYQSIRVDTQAIPPLQKKGKRGKTRKFSFWFSTDDKRTILQINASLKFKSIYGKLLPSKSEST